LNEKEHGFGMLYLGCKSNEIKIKFCFQIIFLFLRLLKIEEHILNQECIHGRS